MGKRRKPTTEELLHGGYQEPYSARDLAKDIIFGIIVSGLAFVWVLVMLLIISFITLSYIKFNIKWMIGISIASAVIAAILYGISTVKKHKR